MKTVYFPYTAVDRTKAEQLCAVWGLLTLLQPSTETCLPETRSLEEAGCIETLFPPADHPQRLIDLMNAFEQWAAGHSGNDLTALMKQGATIPFFSDQSFAQIVTALRRDRKTPPPVAPEKRPSRDIFQDQLLLAMAQKFDRQQDELTREIDTLARKERHMMVLLKGEDDEDSDPLGVAAWSPPVARREAMLDLRLRAWARVMAALPEMENDFRGTEILFLTDGPGVMEQIGECFPEARIRLEAFSLSAGRLPSGGSEVLPPWLAAPLTTQRTAALLQEEKASPILDLTEIRGVSIDRFFLRLAGDQRQEAGAPIARLPEESCWVGSITWVGDTKRPAD
jgi:hypothetical protein